MNDYNKKFKIIIIGESNVGKTSIMLQFSENKVPSNLLATIGIDFKAKIINIENKKYGLQIWDTAGQENYAVLNKNFYNDSDGVLLVYANDNYQSFKRIEKWMNEAKDYSKNEPVFYLVSNKEDLHKDKEFKENEEKIFSEKNNLKFFSVSAIKNSNIELLFKSMTIDLINKKKDIDEYPSNPIKPPNTTGNRCCKS